MSDTKLPILRTAWLSWRDVWRVTYAMPVFATILLVLMIADNVLDDVLTPDESEELIVWQQLLLLAMVIPFALLTTPVLLAFYRRLLLGEVTRRYSLDLWSGRVRAFFAYHAAFRVAALAVPFFIETATVSGALAAVCWITALTIFTAMLFPAVAVDAPGAGLLNAARDVRPLHALVAGILALIPLMLVFAALIFGFSKYVQPFVAPDAGRIPYLSIFSVAGFLIEMISLSLNARFYRAWANRLGRPAGINE